MPPSHIAPAESITRAAMTPDDLDFMQAMFEHAPFGIYETTVDGRFRRVNPEMARLYGCTTPDEFLETFSNTDSTFTHPTSAKIAAYPDKAAREELLARIQQYGYVRRFECLAQRRDGSLFWSQEDARTIYDRQGNVIGYQGFIQDITDQKQKTFFLAEANERLRQIADIAGIGGWELELTTHALWWDDKLREISEVPPEFVPTYERGLRFYPKHVRHKIEKVIHTAITQGEIWDIEVPVVTLRGRLIWARIMGKPCYGHDGTVTKLTGLFQDITNRKVIENELRVARDQARAADSAKTQFLANMSHELRTPLNAILGFSDLIRRYSLSDDATKAASYADYIHESGQHLLDLVNDLLDMARIDLGAYELYEDEVNIHRLIEQAWITIRPIAEHKNLTTEQTLPPDLPSLWADPRALRQVLLNLLANAAKFTPEAGAIHLHVKKDSTGLVIEIRDTGIGIPEDAIDRVLKPFERAYDHLSRDRQSGTGLGLGISYNLIQLHGGALHLHSVPNAGTTATVHLPTERLIPAATA